MIKQRLICIAAAAISCGCDTQSPTYSVTIERKMAVPVGWVGVEVDTTALPPEWRVAVKEEDGWFEHRKRIVLPQNLKSVKILIVPATQPVSHSE